MVSGSPSDRAGWPRSKVSRDSIAVPEYRAGMRTRSHATRPVPVRPRAVTWYRGSHWSSSARSTAAWLAAARSVSLPRMSGCGYGIRGPERTTTRTTPPTWRASTRAPSITYPLAPVGVHEVGLVRAGLGGVGTGVVRGLVGAGAVGAGAAGGGRARDGVERHRSPAAVLRQPPGTDQVAGGRAQIGQQLGARAGGGQPQRAGLRVPGRRGRGGGVRLGGGGAAGEEAEYRGGGERQGAAPAAGFDGGASAEVESLPDGVLGGHVPFDAAGMAWVPSAPASSTSRDSTIMLRVEVTNGSARTRSRACSRCAMSAARRCTSASASPET